MAGKDLVDTAVDMDDVCVVSDVWTYAWGVFLLGCGVGILLAVAMVVLVAWWYLAPQWETTPSSNARHWAGDARRVDEEVVEESDEQCLSTTGVKIAWWDEELDQDVQESPETTSLSLQGNKLHVGTAQYVLLGCKVRLAPRAKRRGPWWPRAPILITFPSMHESTSEQTTDLAEQITEESADREQPNQEKAECSEPAKHPTACLALFLDTPNRKERWYTHLRLASGQVPRAFAVEEEFLGFSGCMLGQSSTYALKTKTRLSGEEENQKKDGGSGEAEDHATSNTPEVEELQGNEQSGDLWVDVEDTFANDAETALNLMLARLYFDATRSQKCRSAMRAKMQRKLSRLAMPEWLAPLRVVDLRFPRVPPRFTQVKVIHRENGKGRKMGVDASDDEEPTWRLGAWMEAEPGTVLTVETSVDWRRSSKEKKEGSTHSESNIEETGSDEPDKKSSGRRAWTDSFAASLHRISLRLELQVGALQGPMEIWIPDPPCDGLFWRFSEKPRLELEAHPKLGRLRLFGRKRLAQKVSAWIAKRLEKEMGKAVVAPGAAAVRVPALVGVDRIEDMDWLDSDNEEDGGEAEDASATPKAKMFAGSSGAKSRSLKAAIPKPKKEKKVKKKRRGSAEGESIFLAEQWQGKYRPKKGKEKRGGKSPTHRRKKTWEEIEEEQEKNEVQEWMKREESMSGMHEWGNGIPVMEGEVESCSSDDRLEYEEIKAATSSTTSQSSNDEIDDYCTDEEVDEEFVQARDIPAEEYKQSRGAGSTGNAANRSLRVRGGFSKMRSSFASMLRRNLSLETHKHRAEELSKMLKNKFGKHSLEAERVSHQEFEHEKEE